MVYSAHDLETHTEVSLQRGGLILIALISGGDYEDVSDARTDTIYTIVTHVSLDRESKVLDQHSHTVLLGVDLARTFWPHTSQRQSKNSGPSSPIGGKE